MMENCNSNVDIVLTNCTGTHVGGIAGWLKGYSEEEYISQVINCNNFGKIDVSGGGYLFIGGILGLAQSTVKNCTNYGEVVCNIIINFENSIDVEIGGIAGYNLGNYGDGPFENNTNYGKIYLEQKMENIEKIYGIYVGGLVGASYISENCNFNVNKGDIEISKIKVTGGKFYIGGLYGEEDDVIRDGIGIFKNGYNSGDIKIKDVEIYDSEERCYVGGAMGCSGRETLICNIYNSGDISIDNAKGISYVGGIIGLNDGWSYSDGEKDITTIRSSYNAGNIAITNSTMKGIGGIAGKNATLGNIENCYSLQNENINKGLAAVAEEETAVVNCGFKSTLEELWNIDFLTNILNWDTSVWNITGGAHPNFINKNN